MKKVRRVHEKVTLIEPAADDNGRKQKPLFLENLERQPAEVRSKIGLHWHVPTARAHTKPENILKISLQQVITAKVPRQN